MPKREKKTPSRDDSALFAFYFRVVVIRRFGKFYRAYFSVETVSVFSGWVLNFFWVSDLFRLIIVDFFGVVQRGKGRIWRSAFVWFWDNVSFDRRVCTEGVIGDIFSLDALWFFFRGVSTTGAFSESRCRRFSKGFLKAEKNFFPLFWYLTLRMLKL